VEDVELVALPAGELLHAVDEVIRSTGAFADEAEVVAAEMLRLRDLGHLSKRVVSDIGQFVYQRGMQSGHEGGFQLTAPIRRLDAELNWYNLAPYPEAQVDPVRVLARFADIALGRAASST
jgi:hypothetical protein